MLWQDITKVPPTKYDSAKLLQDYQTWKFKTYQELLSILLTRQFGRSEGHKRAFVLSKYPDLYAILVESQNQVLKKRFANSDTTSWLLIFICLKPFFFKKKRGQSGDVCDLCYRKPSPRVFWHSHVMVFSRAPLIIEYPIRIEIAICVFVKSLLIMWITIYSQLNCVVSIFFLSRICNSISRTSYCCNSIVFKIYSLLEIEY